MEMHAKINISLHISENSGMSTKEVLAGVDRSNYKQKEHGHM